MLYAKINPTAKIAKQEGALNASTIEANYIGAMARPYAIGGQDVNFELAIGNISTDKDGKQKFERLSSTNVKLTAAELANWGTDDSVVLVAIGTKLGVTASDFVTIVSNNPQF
jgi:hypothetical protein